MTDLIGVIDRDRARTSVGTRVHGRRVSYAEVVISRNQLHNTLTYQFRADCSSAFHQGEHALISFGIKTPGS